MKAVSHHPVLSDKPGNLFIRRQLVFMNPVSGFNLKYLRTKAQPLFNNKIAST